MLIVEIIIYCIFVQISEMPEKYDDLVTGLQSYLNVDSNEIRSNAITLLGLFFSHRTGNEKQAETRIKLIQNFVQFLKESKSSEVRIKAAEALIII